MLSMLGIGLYMLSSTPNGLQIIKLILFVQIGIAIESIKKIIKSIMLLIGLCCRNMKPT